MRIGRLVLVLALLAPAATAADERRPWVGFLYPAGGRRGTTVRIQAGGLNLRGARTVVVSGEGVHATVVGHTPPRRRHLNTDERRELAKRLRQCTRRILTKREPKKDPKQDPDEKPVALPDHPLLSDLDGMDLRELKKVREVFFDPNEGVQFSVQISERVEIEVVIDADAAPGERELRIGTAFGLTNPMPLIVGIHPEIAETEINDFTPGTLPSLDEPIVLNGQVGVRDVDRFRFRARRGQKLVFETRARHLVPYLADAVPGWFQAVIEVRDAAGHGVAYADDYRFDPDPVLFLDVPDDGEYELLVRDAIWRGRDDFVYRITIGETPFIRWMFPIGGAEGVETVAAIGGWNLPTAAIALDTRPGGAPVRSAGLGEGATNLVPFAVSDLPERRETEPNDTRTDAAPIETPGIVNGRILRAGDEDRYRFTGRAGDDVVAEVHARRLDSPLDSLLTVTDARGAVLARCDDRPDPEAGLVTHQADSYVSVKLPADGDYFATVADAQGHGGEGYAYRLRIGPPRPDFAVLVTPSSLNFNAGSRVTATVHAVRKDGFTGDIDLALEGAPGFALEGGRVPAGRDRIRVTISSPANGRPGRPIPLHVVGRARIAGRTITRPAIPAEDMMQAFGLRHLVPAGELLASLGRSRGAAQRIRHAGGPARVPIGGTGRVRLAAPGLPPIPGLRFVLAEPPAGVTLEGVGFAPDALILFLEADAEAAKAGVADNLIVEGWLEREVKTGRDGTGPVRTTRTYVGVLPAIPLEIVAR